MSRADLDVAIDWAAVEGWNPGLADAECFLQTDPDGFLMGFVDGRPVASLSVIAYDDQFGFLGFYIVHPDYRGLGHGWTLWQAGMEYLAGRTVGLDGVVAQQHNYAKSGFVLAHRNIRYGGRVTVDTSPDSLVPVTEIPLETLADYDAALFPARRAAFLRCWLGPRRRFGLAAHRHGGAIAGYGVIRECRDGFKIGPLFADDVETADRLFRGLLAHTGSATVFLDPPEPNGAAVALAERYGLEPVFETARMYKGPPPALPLDRIFGISTFELG